MATLGTVNLSSHQTKLYYWFDAAKEQWRGRLVFTEFRRGIQFGPEVPVEFEAPPGALYREFMELALKHAHQNQNLFWA